MVTTPVKQTDFSRQENIRSSRSKLRLGCKNPRSVLCCSVTGFLHGRRAFSGHVCGDSSALKHVAYISAGQPKTETHDSFFAGGSRIECAAFLLTVYPDGGDHLPKGTVDLLPPQHTACAQGSLSNQLVSLNKRDPSLCWRWHAQIM